MIKIEIVGQTTREAVKELIELSKLIQALSLAGKKSVVTREEVIKEDNLSGETPLPVQEVKEEVEPSKKTEEVKESETPWEEKAISIEEIQNAYINALHDLDSEEKKSAFKLKAKNFLISKKVSKISQIEEKDRGAFLSLINEKA